MSQQSTDGTAFPDNDNDNDNDQGEGGRAVSPKLFGIRAMALAGLAAPVAILVGGLVSELGRSTAAYTTCCPTPW